MNGRPPCVLLVEDDEDVRGAFADRLAHVGFTVVEAIDGVHALAELRIQPVDVVVTDCNMPRLDGFDFLLQCRRAHPAMPIIMMSAASKTTAELAPVIGAFAYLQKPFETDRLVELVRQAVRLSPAPPS